MKKLILLIFIHITNYLHSQGEGNIWYFGENAGIDFNSGMPVALTNSSMSQYEGSASICDKLGNLLFYTNGNTLFNKYHAPILYLLNGSYTSTQSALIVKKPDSNSIYYIFTADWEMHPFGIQYSEFDISLNNDSGGFVSSQPIQLQTPSSEKLISIKNGNKKDFWILTHNLNGNSWLAYLVTNSGVNIVPVISNSGWNFPNSGPCGTGELAVSSNGNKIAFASNICKKAQILDFDNYLGIVSNPVTLPVDTISLSSSSIYGCEFSPDGNMLYYSFFGIKNSIKSTIYQFDLSSGDPLLIQSSMNLIYKDTAVIGHLKKGIDNKIYAARAGDYHLGVINSPNNYGLACNYNDTGFYLGGRISNIGLPNIIHNEIDFIIDSVIIDSVIPNITFPNVFSPNNDGFNDLFYFPNKGIVEFNCKIYNRWGNLVYEFNQINEGWNGRTNSGKECSEGTYFYVVTYKFQDSDFKKAKGFVTLLR